MFSSLSFSLVSCSAETIFPISSAAGCGIACTTRALSLCSTTVTVLCLCILAAVMEKMANAKGSTGHAGREPHPHLILRCIWALECAHCTNKKGQHLFCVQNSDSCKHASLNLHHCYIVLALIPPDIPAINEKSGVPFHIGALCT